MKRISMIIGLLLSCLYSKAEPVDTTTAKIVATNFYLSRVDQTGLKSIGLKLVYDCKGIISEIREESVYYVFNVDNNRGFVIVSAEDNTVPILGYSDNGAYSKTNQPPAFIEWMKHYEEQIIYIKENQILADQRIESQWGTYKSALKSSRLKAIIAVELELTTEWGQRGYYNRYCQNNIGNVPVGCVAVAMGQIMNYWGYPGSNDFIPGYNDDINEDDDSNPIPGSDYGPISSVEETYYNWNEMPDALIDGSSNVQIDAVSELLCHCGVAVKMNYGPYGSGAYSIDVDNALVDYFKYSAECELIRRFWHPNNWENLLKNELDNKRPIYYDGQGTGRHAFVCEGYDDLGKFYFNWGWYGLHDGYFHLHDLTPGDPPYENDFSGYQLAIINISPPGVIDQMEPNNTYIKACDLGELSSGFTYSNYNLTLFQQDEDWFKFTYCNKVYYIKVKGISESTEGAYGFEVYFDGSDIYIETRLSNGVTDTQLFLYDKDHTTILAHDDDGGYPPFSFIDYTLQCPPNLIYSNSRVYDGINGDGVGNGDSKANAGEEIDLEVELRNTGTGDAHNVQAELSTDDPYINITDRSENWGDIPAGTTEWEADFDFDVASNCPERDVLFSLTITSDEGTWTDQLLVHIYPPIGSPNLEFYSYRIDDDNNTSNGNNNGLVEPGESIEMPVSLINNGTSDAHNVRAFLSTTDPYISITDDDLIWDLFPTGAIDEHSDYDFNVAADCPEKDVLFSLIITSDEGSWTDQFSLHVFGIDTWSNELKVTDNIIIYPNPTADKLYIVTTVDLPSDYTIKLIDFRGQALKVEKVNGLWVNEHYNLDISSFNTGVYIIEIEGKEFTKQVKIVKE
ncbi:T9SS C-terminal target domain-containing protein [Marinilabiliaceae bacterium JC017]|nr:T9SS C-terminal target domain-containing protein [Marinilabiliaceae bacterium JC017]